MPADAHFDVAVCIFVLHFLPDEGKLSLLRGIRERLQPHVPLLVASAIRPPNVTALRDDFLGAWQQYGEVRNPAAQAGGLRTGERNVRPV
jgi:tRNA (cmo5U34)-methyltransferase